MHVPRDTNLTDALSHLACLKSDQILPTNTEIITDSEHTCFAMIVLSLEDQHDYPMSNKERYDKLKSHKSTISSFQEHMDFIENGDSTAIHMMELLKGYHIFYLSHKMILEHKLVENFQYFPTFHSYDQYLACLIVNKEKNTK